MASSPIMRSPLAAGAGMPLEVMEPEDLSREPAVRSAALQRCAPLTSTLTVIGLRREGDCPDRGGQQGTRPQLLGSWEGRPPS
eukprot:8198973-Pyramimonas_sp.AAC.1